MVKTADDIYNDLIRLERQNTGNSVETITTYSVQSRTVTLLIEKTPSGSNRYNVKICDSNTGEYADTCILFTHYPSEYIDHSAVCGNNSGNIYRTNNGIIRNVHNICKAIAKLYNVGVGKIW